MAQTYDTVDGILRSDSTAKSLRIGYDKLPAPLRRNAELGVLDITEWFGDTSGGIRTYLMQKAQYVSARPWLRHVLTVPGRHDAIAEAPGVRMYGLQGPPIPTQSPYRLMLATKSISKIVQHETPDLIEIGSPFIVPWIVRHATRNVDVPMVCFYHTNLPRMFAPNERQTGSARRMLYRACWSYMRRLDQLFPLTIVASDYSARELAQEGITRVAKVPLGVDLSLFHPDRRRQKAVTRARFGLPKGPLAAFVGRFAREKELVVVLDAWRTIEASTGARLALIGAGPMLKTLRAHSYADRVTFIPFQNNRETLADLLASLDVYIAPGRIETFGLSSLEALASGTPVLSADQGGVSELVARSRAGCTFAAGESESLASEAIKLFDEPLAELGARGRLFAEAEHAWDKVFDRLFDVYRGVLAARPQHGAS